MTEIKKEQLTNARVLAKSLFKVSEKLELGTYQLADALGLDEQGINKLKKQKLLDPKEKKGKVAIKIILIARGLDSLTGGDKDWMRAFMHSSNSGTGGIPANQIATNDGLIKVLDYVNEMKRKNS
jgi:hypothetical protein